MEQKVADFIRAEGLLAPAEKVLLAVSGGADSTALLHVMVALKTAGVLPVDIVCAHINHQLRGDEANRDENFVIEQCKKLRLPVITKKIDVREYAQANKLSIETAARLLRINALLEIAEQNNCTCIATAHQKNDNAETIIHRLSRGTGFRGLCGIWPVKQFPEDVRFVRPLLCISRPQIVKYLEKRKLKWCEDRTNLDCYYRRNFIRNRVLPALQKDCKSDLVEQIAQLANATREFYRPVYATADIVWPKAVNDQQQTVEVDFSILAEQSPEVQIEIVRRVLSRLGVGEQDFTQQHYQNILTLSRDAKLQLPGTVLVHRQGAKIVFGHYRERICKAGLAPPKRLKVPGKTQFSDVLIETELFDYNPDKFEEFRAKKSKTIEWLDFDKLKPPLKVRFRRPGDRFWPLGLKAEKKVGKFLTDEKVTQKTRQKSLVISDKEKIIWLCPLRLSERAKVTGQTKRILQLKVLTD